MMAAVHRMFILLFLYDLHWVPA